MLVSKLISFLSHSPDARAVICVFGVITAIGVGSMTSHLIKNRYCVDDHVMVIGCSSPTATGRIDVSK
jgi:hypothetical protein